jgi:hypothetical protein
VRLMERLTSGKRAGFSQQPRPSTCEEARQMSEMQTIEIRFPGERLGSYTDSVGTTWTLFR